MPAARRAFDNPPTHMSGNPPATAVRLRRRFQPTQVPLLGCEAENASQRRGNEIEGWLTKNPLGSGLRCSRQTNARVPWTAGGQPRGFPSLADAREKEERACWAVHQNIRYSVRPVLQRVVGGTVVSWLCAWVEQVERAGGRTGGRCSHDKCVP